MSPTQYALPTVDATWAASRETHIAVATAIHAISGPGRTPEQILQEIVEAVPAPVDTPA